METYISPFELASSKERFALRHILPKNTKYTKIKSTIRYDAMTTINNKSYIVEAKVRTKHYTAQLYESNKHSDLLELSENSNMPILYITFTPQGTYIFNITKLMITNPEFFIKSNIDCPKTTAEKSYKVNKDVFLLPIELAIYRNYIFNLNDFNDDFFSSETIIIN
jgi:hypothetical protein